MFNNENGDFPKLWGKPDNQIYEQINSSDNLIKPAIWTLKNS